MKLRQDFGRIWISDEVNDFGSGSDPSKKQPFWIGSGSVEFGIRTPLMYECETEPELFRTNLVFFKFCTSPNISRSCIIIALCH